MHKCSSPSKTRFANVKIGMNQTFDMLAKIQCLAFNHFIIFVI